MVCICYARYHIVLVLARMCSSCLNVRTIASMHGHELSVGGQASPWGFASVLAMCILCGLAAVDEALPFDNTQHSYIHTNASARRPLMSFDAAWSCA